MGGRILHSLKTNDTPFQDSCVLLEQVGSEDNHPFWVGWDLAFEKLDEVLLIGFLVDHYEENRLPRDRQPGLEFQVHLMGSEDLLRQSLHEQLVVRQVLCQRGG